VWELALQAKNFRIRPPILAGKAGSHTRRKSPANQQLFLKLKTDGFSVAPAPSNVIPDLIRDGVQRHYLKPKNRNP